MTDSAETWEGPVVDEPVGMPVPAAKSRFIGRVWNVNTDTVQIGDQTVDRDYVVHSGAVAIIALDDQERVYLIRQYRHPVGMYLFEPPAGLIDKAGEEALATAKRELAEEAGLEAADWSLLVDYFTSPGGMSESIRIYLARSVRELPDGRIHTGEAEEVELPGVWLPLDEAVGKVLDGSIHNTSAVVGLLAAARARDEGWKSLRAPDTVWDTRDWMIEMGRVHLGRDHLAD